MGAVNGTSTSGGTLQLANAGLTTVATPALAGSSYYGLGIAFRLSDLQGYAEFTALYDQYRVVRLTYTLSPAWTSARAPSTSPNGDLCGWVHSVYDYDDNAAPAASTAGIGAMMERASYALTHAVKTTATTWVVEPRVALAAYAASAFTSYANSPACWVDCSSPNVEHYGLKLLIELINPGSASVFMNFRLHVTAEVEFRQSR